MLLRIVGLGGRGPLKSRQLLHPECLHLPRFAGAAHVPFRTINSTHTSIRSRPRIQAPSPFQHPDLRAVSPVWSSSSSTKSSCASVVLRRCVRWWASQVSTGGSSSSSSSQTFAQRIRPYVELARYDKPIGTWLLFLPCTFSLTLAAQHLAASPAQVLACYAIFGTGALVMRGAGCTINDMWDRKLDQGVERTRSRPIASGALTPMNALVFLSGQLSLGLAVLLQLNWYSIFFGATSLGLVIVYPLMKRITHWPQLVLGLAFNWGSLLGYAALGGHLHLPIVLPLYAGTVCWTILYDTIYAHQDAKDDLATGIKSTALLFGDKTKPILSLFGTCFVGSTAVAMGNASSGAAAAAAAQALPPSASEILAAAKQAWSLPAPSTIVEALSTAVSSIDLSAHPAGCAALGAVAAHLYWQIKTVDLADRADCWSKFRSNRDVGLLLWFGLAVDYAISLMW
ncbi:4-hydroxybenzoate polyprenyl transferase [Ceraceosorus guamensis]|uniref:4-hydroxybenzoate polyprenyltransferase, mitochondrial n=1 Tax=Ceraceosorus guamensis TaxID=1522189 RepID=A0A316W498_9BASI|nr:4-hydroxybenzoate polyprenyl transferase [Ceraceosorus guamensis]PWN43451.1 4-hydroxybenzoate polyprenyl transferase [Ceraceosorus guamensis]